MHRLGTGTSPSPHAVDGGEETPTLLGLAETAPYFHDGRFATLADVVAWFDASFALGMTPAERSDLAAYVAAVGAVDRPADDRPLARRLDQSFSYLSLLTVDHPPRVWLRALDAVSTALRDEPSAVSARATAMRGRLARMRAEVARGGATQALAAEAKHLRKDLAMLAADWAGARD